MIKKRVPSDAGSDYYACRVLWCQRHTKQRHAADEAWDYLCVRVCVHGSIRMHRTGNT